MNEWKDWGASKQAAAEIEALLLWLLSTWSQNPETCMRQERVTEFKWKLCVFLMHLCFILLHFTVRTKCIFAVMISFTVAKLYAFNLNLIGKQWVRDHFVKHRNHIVSIERKWFKTFENFPLSLFCNAQIRQGWNLYDSVM